MWIGYKMMNLRLWTPKKSPNYIYFSILFCQRKWIDLTNERFVNKYECCWLLSSIMFTSCHKWQFYSCSYKRAYLFFTPNNLAQMKESCPYKMLVIQEKKSLVERCLQMIFMDVSCMLNRGYFGKYKSSLGMLCSVTFLAE